MPDVDEFLEHHGVKGMKWGKHMAKPSSERAVARADRKWERSADTRRHRKAVHKATVSRMNNVEIRKLNEKPEYSKKNLKRDPMLRKQYLDDFSSTMEKVMAEESSRIVGTSPSGRTTFKFRDDPVRGRLVGSFTEVREAKHADDDVEFEFETNELGHIVSLREVEAVTHDEEIDAYLAHHGVKGMKWGVRRDPGHEGEVVKTKALAKLDKKWEKENTGVSGYLKLYNGAAEKMNNGGIDEINNRPEFKEASEKGIFNDINHPTTKKYYAAHEKAFADAMIDVGAKIGTNPSGSQRFEVREVEGPDGNKYRDLFLVPTDEKVKHAEGELELAFRMVRDAKGLVTKYVAVDLTDNMRHYDSDYDVYHIDGEDPVNDFLEHYGVKGMKWGVSRKIDTSERLRRVAEGNASRKDKFDTFMGKGNPWGLGGVHGLRPKVAAKRADKLDRQIEKKLSGERGKIKRGATKAGTALDAGKKVIDEGEKKLIFLPEKNRREAASGTQTRVLGEAMRVNRDPRFKGKDLKRDPELKKAYFDEVQKKAVDIYKDELGTARTQAVNDVIDAVMAPRQDSMSFTARSDRIRHADGGVEVLLRLVFEFDELGHISGVKIDESSLSPLKHDDDGNVDEFLEHYGVKGMKWGVVRETLQRDTTAQPATAAQKRPGTRVTASGGKNLPATEEALTAAKIRQTARKSRTDALSNAELQAAIRRMQLEQDFARLTAPRQSKGKKFLKSMLGDVGKEKAADRLDFHAEEDPRLKAVANAFRKNTNTPRPKKRKGE